MNFPWHPFVLSAFPILFLYAHNIEQFNLRVVFAPLGVTLGAAGLLIVGLRLLTKNVRKAAMIVSVLVATVFSYGHVRAAIPPFAFSLFGRVSGPAAILLPGYLLACLVGVVLLARTKRSLQSATKVLNALAIGLIFIPLVTIIPQEVGRLSRSDESRDRPSVQRGSVLPEQKGDLPNIFLIILDAYGRADILDEIYGYDNEPFLRSLEQRGFYVARRATSNYWMTSLSIPTALHMNYLRGVFDHISPDWTDRTRIARLSDEAEALSVLRHHDYKIVRFHSGYAAVESIKPDVTRSAGWGIDEFSQGLLDTTVIPHLSLRRGLSAKCYTRRKDVLFAMEHLGDTSDFGGPALVIAHIVSPHGPFLFGANGEDVAISGETCSKDVYKQAYRDQLIYVNTSILPAIDRILANSKRPPVIVLMADHGPCAAYTSGSRRQTDQGLRERFSILNAFHFPNGTPEALYESISPVNTFRVIFNHCFGMDYELLEDRSFLSSEARPFDFIEVTDVLVGEKTPQE